MKSELSQFDNLLEPIIGRRTKLFRDAAANMTTELLKPFVKRVTRSFSGILTPLTGNPSVPRRRFLTPCFCFTFPIIRHNNGYKIEQYLPTLIESALAQGYSFVTVSDLLLDGETLIDVNGVKSLPGNAAVPYGTAAVPHFGRGGSGSPRRFFAYFYLYYVFLRKNCETIPILIKKT